MSLQAILDAIRTSGEAQLREVEAQAQARADGILAEARVNAQRLQEETRNRVVLQASKESARLLQQARLEVLQIVGNMRERLIDQALEETRKRLACLRSDPVYPEVLRLLTEEALRELGTSLRASEQPQLAADPHDRELLDGILSEMGLGLLVSYELSCQGGVIARSEDGRVMVVNTLEIRLERAIPYLHRHFAALFEEVLLSEEKI